MLGGMLGTTLSLSVMDYQALIDAHIDAFDFLNALATRLDLTGVTYDSVLSGNVKVADIVAAMLSAQQAANGLNAATTALSQHLAGACRADHHHRAGDADRCRSL